MTISEKAVARDFRAEISAGGCSDNQGCGVVKICMCALAEEMADEIDRLRALSLHKHDLVAVNPSTLRKLLERVADVARAHLCSYDRTNKTYPFDDDIWRSRDPDGFDLYAELRAALPPVIVADKDPT
jgi:hypothetical protein